MKEVNDRVNERKAAQDAEFARQKKELEQRRKELEE